MTSHRTFLFFFFILLSTQFSNAQVNSVKEQGSSRILFSFNKVCSFFGIKDPLMADKLNAKQIDCMGKVFDIDKFCLSKFSSDKKFTKARFDVTNEKVSCHFAEISTVEVTCAKGYKHYCDKPKESCMKLKLNFAYNLKLIREYLLESFPSRLKCHFAKPSDKIELSL